MPPMSTLTTSDRPAREPDRAAAVTPPVGPDPMVATARWLAAVAVATPPAEVATRRSWS